MAFAPPWMRHMDRRLAELAGAISDLVALQRDVFGALQSLRYEIGNRVTDLERRATKAEGQIVDHEDRLRHLEGR